MQSLANLWQGKSVFTSDCGQYMSFHQVDEREDASVLVRQVYNGFEKSGT
jgi:hypothetical protein